MLKNLLVHLVRATAFLFLCSAALIAQAQTNSPAWPTQPVKLVVGFPAGSSPDLLARLIGPPLSAALGQPVVVENRVGASGTIGVDAVARSKDVHTLAFTSNVPLTSAGALSRLPYSVEKDLAPISLVATSPLVLVVDARLPINDISDLLTYAQQRPGELNFGSPGIGSGGHLTMELFNALANIKAVHIPYQSYPQSLNSILSGEIQYGFMVPSVALPQVRAGKVRLLGISSSKPSALLPNIPPISQALGKPFNPEVWTAVLGPASMDRTHIQKVAVALSTIVRSDVFRQQLLDQGWESVGGSPEALSIRIRSDSNVWTSVVKASGTKGQ